VRTVVLVARDEAGTVRDDVGRLVGRLRAPDPRRLAPAVRRAAVVRGIPGE
jgi:hypothetical protein